MSSVNLQPILNDYKLNESNFEDWYLNLRIVLKHEKIGYVIEKPMPPLPPATASPEEMEAYEMHKADNDAATCIMLASMTSALQKQHEKIDAMSMILHLKEMFDARARTERYETSKQLYRCKMAEGSSVSAHVLKMIGLIEKLADLGHIFDNELSIDLILQSLPDSYSQFIMNFNMNKLECSLTELLNMLKTAEPTIKKEKGTIMLVAGSKKKKPKNGLKKSKKKAAKPNGGVKKDKPKGTCFHCGQDGHWKRNCKAYLDSLKSKKLGEASTSGMYMIEINLSTNKDSWVLDTGCGSHICTNMQGLKKSRLLAKREVELRVGNGARVAALAVGTYVLSLPTGLILELENCYYVPVLTKNIISISALDLDGFTIIQRNKSCSFSRDGITYGTGSLINGLYILDEDKSILNIDTKRQKLDIVKQSYLWHCRLGHVNEKRISKLHKDGYLDSFDYESFETCESCLLGKMTKTPFTGKGERASDLLGLIHTDVCGPMSIHARGGFSYFITFTDDHIRYGHVYLMKHKICDL